MGAVQATAAPAIHVSVVMPSKGNKILKSKFFKEAPKEHQSVHEYFREKLQPMVNIDPAESVCGDLLRATVMLRGGDEEIEVEELSDNALLYVQMGITRACFYVEQSDMQTHGTKKNTVDLLTDVLVRQPTVELPMWSHAGRPAMTLLHGQLRELLSKDRLGFQGSMDLKSGGDWMIGVVECLYKLSPFHDKLKVRGHPVPKRFAFSAGADDFKRKSRAAPMLSQEILEQVNCIVI